MIMIKNDHDYDKNCNILSIMAFFVMKFWRVLHDCDLVS